MRLVTDPSYVAELILLKDNIVDDTYNIHTDWILRNKWIAVPVDRNSYYLYDEDDENYLGHDKASMFIYFLAAMKEFSIGEYLAIPATMLVTDPLSREAIYEAQPNAEDLDNLDREIDGISNYLLVPENRFFALLWTVDYFILSGPIEFVEKVINCDWKAAIDKFPFECFSVNGVRLEDEYHHRQELHYKRIADHYKKVSQRSLK